MFILISNLFLKQPVDAVNVMNEIINLHKKEEERREGRRGTQRQREKREGGGMERERKGGLEGGKDMT